MADNKKSEQRNVQFNVEPGKTPVMYADSYLIGSNEHVATFSFAQALPQPDQQHIVSRVALTRAQAKDFLSRLSDHVQKFEL